MTWLRLVTDAGARDRITGVICEIVMALDEVVPTTATAWCHRAILRAYLADDDVVSDPGDVSGAALASAAACIRPDLGVALFHGLAGVGFTVAHLTEKADEVFAHFDGEMLRALEGPWHGDYDLVGGLVGLGVYALERGEGGRAIAGRVIDQLVDLARPRGGGTGWMTPRANLPAWQREHAPEGYWNLGLAHGVAGVIALCARFAAVDVESVRARELLAGATRFLLTAGPPFPAWQIDGTNDAPSRRLAWCYNDLGIATALLAAAAVDDRWANAARELALDCARRAVADAQINDASLCHGAAGIAHLFNRMYQATGMVELGEAARRWIEHTLAMRTTDPVAGFPAYVPEAEGTIADASWLMGATGVALALHAAISETEPRWDRLLLVDLAADLA